MTDPLVIIDLGLLVGAEGSFAGFGRQVAHPTLISRGELEVENGPCRRGREGCLVGFQYPAEDSHLAGASMGDVHECSFPCNGCFGCQYSTVVGFQGTEMWS